MSGVFEGTDSIYYDKQNLQGEPYFKFLEKELGDKLKSLELMDENTKVSKGCLIYQGIKKEKIESILGNYFELMYHTDTLLEFVPKDSLKLLEFKKYVSIFI